MSLIENLRSEVREKESEHAAHLAEREAQQAYYLDKVRPPMLQALNYFSEVVESLKFLNTTTRVELPISPDGQSTVAMEQAGYEFFYDDAKNPLRLDIVCECRLISSQRYNVQSPEGVRLYTEFLDSMEFAYHRKTELDRQYDIRSALFELQGPLKIGVSIQARPADRCVYIYLRNLEGLPEKRYRFSPEKMDSVLMERVAQLVLREESALVSVELPTGFRNDLRAQVAAQKMEQDLDLKQAMEEMRLEREAELEAKKLTTKIRNLTTAIKSVLSRD